MVEGAGTLQVGQTVAVREHQSFGVVVAVLPEGEPGHQVVEVGSDCLVLADSGTGTRTRLPWYLVSLEPQAPPRPPQAFAAGTPADGGEQGNAPPPDAIPA
jgi:hypothetical protein